MTHSDSLHIFANQHEIYPELFPFGRGVGEYQVECYFVGRSDHVGDLIVNGFKILNFHFAK